MASSFLPHWEKTVATEHSLAVIEQCLGTAFHMAHFPVPYTPNPCGDLKQSWNLLPLPDEVIKPRLRASAEGEEGWSRFESLGSLSILLGAQVPVLLQCYKASLYKE